MSPGKGIAALQEDVLRADVAKSALLLAQRDEIKKLRAAVEAARALRASLNREADYYSPELGTLDAALAEYDAWKHPVGPEVGG